MWQRSLWALLVGFMVFVFAVLCCLGVVHVAQRLSHDTDAVVTDTMTPLLLTIEPGDSGSSQVRPFIQINVTIRPSETEIKTTEAGDSGSPKFL